MKMGTGFNVAPNSRAIKGGEVAPGYDDSQVRGKASPRAAVPAEVRVPIDSAQDRSASVAHNVPAHDRAAVSTRRWHRKGSEGTAARLHPHRLRHWLTKRQAAVRCEIGSRAMVYDLALAALPFETRGFVLDIAHVKRVGFQHVMGAIDAGKSRRKSRPWNAPNFSASAIPLNGATRLEVVNRPRQAMNVDDLSRDPVAVAEPAQKLRAVQFGDLIPRRGG